MLIIYVIESLLYYVSIMIISVKILDNTTNLKNTPLLLVYIPVGFLAFILKYDSFMNLYPLVFILNLLLLKLTLKNAKLTSLLYVYFFLFAVNTIITSVTLTFINVQRDIIEVSTHFLMTALCLIGCYSKLNVSIKAIPMWTPKRIKLLILILMSLNMVVLALILDIYREAYNEKWLFLIHRVLVLLVLFVCAMLPILVSTSIANAHLKHQAKYYEEEIKAEAKHYIALSKNTEDIRRFRHDFKNLKIGLTKLVAEGCVDEALTMLNEWDGTLVNIENTILRFDTGNGIVDAMLADKQQTASLHNITLSFSGAVPAEGIAPTDLCVLFGNTIDNAIEACQKFPLEIQKTIHIRSHYMNGFLFLRISNPVVENVTIRDNTLSTTKTDKSLHGFGLYSLDKIVTSHDGTLLLSCESNIFEVNIHLCVA